MKLIIFGSTGSVGRHIVKQALEQGHEVTAFARKPEALGFEHDNLTLFSGDVFNPTTIKNAMKDHDAALITLGSSKLTGDLRSTGTRNIVNAMKENGVKRLICQTTLGAGDSVDNLNFLWRYVLFGVLLRFVMKDHIIQEDIVKNSGLDWTIVRPSAFTNDLAANNYQHGFDAKHKGLALKIPRVEVAEFMLKNLNNLQYIHKTPGLSY